MARRQWRERRDRRRAGALGGRLLRRGGGKAVSAARVKDIRHWEDGAAVVGRCPERDCSGTLLLVEDVGPWKWSQCNVCHVQQGVVPRRPAPAKGKDAPDEPDYSDDAFLGAS